MVSEEQRQKLIRLATQARIFAYAPYSHYKVGAAVLGSSGEFYAGCNIENAAYTPTIHTEMLAIYNAVAQGDRHFLALAVVTEEENPPFPCALCRQVMAEFCGSDLEVIAANMQGKYRVKSLGKLYPEAFGPGNIK